MAKEYIYVKLYNNNGLSSNDVRVKLKNKCNKIVFDGKTNYFGKIKIPVCNNKVYKLIVYYNLTKKVIPLIARANEVYCINISGNKEKKHLITVMLMDKYNPNIKIEGGKMILWQDTQYQ